MPRYYGAELRAKVLEAAEAEVESSYVTTWANAPDPFPRPARGWQWWARTQACVSSNPSERARRARSAVLRGALTKALREAQADRGTWSDLLIECPQLADVWISEPMHEDAASDDEIAELKYRLLYIGNTRGPTWRPDAPATNRDYALQVILSGWASKSWPERARDAMRVSEAIDKVVGAVNTHRRSKRRADSSAPK